MIDHSGHPDRLQSSRRDVINKKLDLCAKAVQMQPEQRERIREAWWNVAKATDIGDPIKTMAGWRKL